MLTSPLPFRIVTKMSKKKNKIKLNFSVINCVVIPQQNWIQNSFIFNWIMLIDYGVDFERYSKSSSRIHGIYIIELAKSFVNWVATESKVQTQANTNTNGPATRRLHIYIIITFTAFSSLSICFFCLFYLRFINEIFRFVLNR